MKRVVGIVLSLGLLAACGPKTPKLQSAHPGSFSALVKLAPECRAPSAAEYDACETAAKILEQDPQTATKIFIANWEHVVFNRPVRPIDAPFWVSDANRDPASGRLVLPADLSTASTDDVKVAAAERITVKALLKVYKRAGDRYSLAMLPAIQAVQLRDVTTLASFTSTHVFAVSGASGKPPVMVMAAAPKKDDGLPKGHGPLPLQTKSKRWEVVEAGQMLEITLADGSVKKGTLAACNSQALLLDLGNGQQAVVATSDVKDLSKQ